VDGSIKNNSDFRIGLYLQCAQDLENLSEGRHRVNEPEVG